MSGREYTVKACGINSKGNYWWARDYGPSAVNQNTYVYSNADGSFYYSNPDGSTYFNDGKGSFTYTTPSGLRFSSRSGGSSGDNSSSNSSSNGSSSSSSSGGSVSGSGSGSGSGSIKQEEPLTTPATEAKFHSAEYNQQHVSIPNGSLTISLNYREIAGSMPPATNPQVQRASTPETQAVSTP
ncbi:hypothetical protein F4804DRAFT_350013 [Jackrogersella minutella]|nr:hypothetical protein F4804DRAFT_350013 [Jackrogersella minutella]